jgi:hypothetical protein
MKADYFYLGLVISLRCFCPHALVLWNLSSPGPEHLRIGQLYFLLMHRRRCFIGVIVLAVTTGHCVPAVDVFPRLLSFRTSFREIRFDFALPMRWTRLSYNDL